LAEGSLCGRLFLVAIQSSIVGGASCEAVLCCGALLTLLSYTLETFLTLVTDAVLLRTWASIQYKVYLFSFQDNKANIDDCKLNM
jgi:hypothetical protein